MFIPFTYFILLLPPTYVVCGKVMFSVMFVCQSVCLFNWGVPCDLPMMHWGPSWMDQPEYPTLWLDGWTNCSTPPPPPRWTGWGTPLLDGQMDQPGYPPPLDGPTGYTPPPNEQQEKDWQMGGVLLVINIFTDYKSGAYNRHV